MPSFGAWQSELRERAEARASNLAKENRKLRKIKRAAQQLLDRGQILECAPGDPKGSYSVPYKELKRLLNG